MGIPLEGFAGTDSGLHLEAKRQKLHHLMAFHQLCGNDLYVAAFKACRETEESIRAKTKKNLILVDITC
ncbi:hypothetical protein MITS9509_00995 [Synechococcus sp. MIT S9509]|nr:hypothetical protein MITS9509_00995 [Synechococcus sp. MIT S9509]